MGNSPTAGSNIGMSDRMRIKQLNPELEGGTSEIYTVLVNPTSYGVTHEACYDKSQDIKGTGTTYSFNKIKPQGMKIDLLFDSTGSLGAIPFLENESVLSQINRFLSIAFISYEKDTKPKHLQLIWGEMEFKGVLQSIDITYSHFDATGAPIRAKADCKFTGGSLKFNTKDKEKTAEKAIPIAAVVNFSTVKHPINAVQKQGSYIEIISQQAKPSLPKSLRKAKEVAKMIIK
ncbi:MAG: hypothetical protein ACJA1C_001826 [Crocinitomicaceae bacterium]|jgi:hypothetical protein